MSDFNINLLNYNNHKDSTTFLDAMFFNSFSLIITVPTRAEDTLITLIDNIFQNKPLKNDMIAVNLRSLISDYLIRFLVEPSSFTHNSSKDKIRRCNKK